MTATTLDPAQVGARAVQITTAVEDHPDFIRLRMSSVRYVNRCATFTGYPLISRWNRTRDADPLVTEALRVLALKAAVYELTDADELTSELPVPPPINEAMHALLAQFTVMTWIQADLDLWFPYATELQRSTYTRGCSTDIYYTAAGWGDQPTRYWFDSDEAHRRQAILNAHYRDAGIGPDGNSHYFDFGSTPA